MAKPVRSKCGLIFLSVLAVVMGGCTGVSTSSAGSNSTISTQNNAPVIAAGTSTVVSPQSLGLADSIYLQMENTNTQLIFSFNFMKNGHVVTFDNVFYTVGIGFNCIDIKHKVISSYAGSAETQTSSQIFVFDKSSINSAKVTMIIAQVSVQFKQDGSALSSQAEFPY